MHRWELPPDAAEHARCLLHGRHGSVPSSCAPRARRTHAGAGGWSGIRHGSVFDTAPRISGSAFSRTSRGGVYGPSSAAGGAAGVRGHGDDGGARGPRTCVGLMVSVVPSSSTYVSHEACGLPAVVPLCYGRPQRARATQDGATGAASDGSRQRSPPPAPVVVGCALPPELVKQRAAQAAAEAQERAAAEAQEHAAAEAQERAAAEAPAASTAAAEGGGPDQADVWREGASTCGQLRRAVHERLLQVWRGQPARMPVRLLHCGNRALWPCVTH